MNGSNASRLRAVRGPVTIITVGALFALNNFTPYRFSQTWPVILIVFGLLSLLCRGAEPAPPRYPYNPPPPPYPPQGPYNVPPQGTYNTPPAGAAGRGGFGSSAPPRGAEQTTDAPPPGGAA